MAGVVSRTWRCEKFVAVVVIILLFILYMHQCHHVRLSMLFSTNNNVAMVTTQSREPSWITFIEVGGIGNELFNLAISMQLAQTQDMKLMIASQSPLHRAFALHNYVTQYSSIDELQGNHTIVREKPHFDCKYDASFVDKLMNVTSPGKVLLGYFQSWRYFAKMEQHLRTVLQFKSHVDAMAVEYIRGTVTKHTDLDDDQYILVGIHVRRGDVTTNSKLLKYGYPVVPALYYEHAVNYFSREFNSSRLVFIVCTNDMSWSKKNLNHLHPNVIFSERNTDAVDLAILANCKHVIVSIGTFGWWGGWLSGGITVYYKNWPRKGSALEKVVDKSDYYLPHWIAIE